MHILSPSMYFLTMNYYIIGYYTYPVNKQLKRVES